MTAKTVFYLRIKDTRDGRIFHESNNYDTMEELFEEFKYWLDQEDTQVIFSKRVIMIP